MQVWAQLRELDRDVSHSESQQELEVLLLLNLGRV